MPVVAGRQAIRGAGIQGFLAELNSEVKVLRPKLDGRGVDVVSGRRAQLFQDRRGEPVPATDERRGGRFDVEGLTIELHVVGQQMTADVVGRGLERRDRCASLAGRILYDESCAAYADLNVRREERRAKAIARVTQSDLPLALRLAGETICSARRCSAMRVGTSAAGAGANRR